MLLLKHKSLHSRQQLLLFVFINYKKGLHKVQCQKEAHVDDEGL